MFYKHVNLEVERTHLSEYPSKEPMTLTDPQRQQSISACPDLSEKDIKDRHVPKNHTLLKA